MTLPAPTIDFEPELVDRGKIELAALSTVLEAADPNGLVLPRSRVLCAGLAHLGVLTLRGLGGGASEGLVSRAGALLSLVTKVDDQIIDGLAFHGGLTTPAAEARQRTAAYLGATFDAIVRGHSEEPRLGLAAALGRSLAELAATRARLEAMWDTIAEGFAIQADAVATLTRHPASVSLAEVADITRKISGAWLHMIAATGALPSDCPRSLTPAEKHGFFAWGAAIQRVDALADLEKDLADGHLATYPGRLLYDACPAAYLEAARTHDPDALYSLVHTHHVDEACLADPAEDPRAFHALEGLGEVPSLLAWIRHYLVRRYHAHPRSRALPPQASSASPLSPALSSRGVLFPTASRGLSCSEP